MAACRVGLGWDVHALVSGRPTVLAGVVLTGEFGPKGHSDGDPLAHAVCDALLGAAALGDIGMLFPDTDPEWKDAPGSLLLAQTAAALGRAGWRPVQIDAVVVADEPKIGPHRDAIRAGLARALGLPVEAVSVKGKRTEGLGGLAGGKGIACHALAVIERLGETSP
jgi:2-C-methyl-D-erythritol 2,4-cyclodiphosphate synthase